MTHLRKGKKALQSRQESAANRQAWREALTPDEQIKALRKRPGISGREIARLS